MISTQSLATRILVIQLPLKTLKLRQQLLNFWLKQLINEPTHIQGKSVSCFNLIFSFQPNLVVSSSSHSSLHQNCHHQVLIAKFSLKVHYPPPRECEVWHFKKANTDHIKNGINGFSWERSFASLDVNDKVYLFNKTIENVLSNFISHEIISFENRDPPWINSQVKHLINEKMLFSKIVLNTMRAMNLLKCFSPFTVN